MSTTEVLSGKTLEEIVREITEDRWIQPHMGREDSLGEARGLLQVMRRDINDLCHRRIPQTVVDTFDESIELYDKASSMLAVTLFDRTDVRNEWDSIERDAYTFKWDMIDELEFALRNNEKALVYVKKIIKGRGRRDLVCDYGDIAEMIRKYRSEMEAINFDFTNLERCETDHVKLANLLSKLETSPELIEEHRVFAAQAFTYMTECIKVIREYGQHVYRRNEDKLNDYKSDFYQRLGRMNKATETGNVSE